MPADGAETVARHGRLMRGGLTVWALLIYLFLFAPIVLLVLFSFNANQYGTFPITGWTTHWYNVAFGDYQIQSAVKTTVQVALEVTLISTVVGTAAAFPLVRSRLRFRSGIRAALILPIMLPGLLIGVSLLTMFTQVLHSQLTIQTAVIGQSVYTTPFVILVVAARLEGFDRSLERAASDLGASAFQRILYVILPLIGPAVFAGGVRVHALTRRVHHHALPDRRREHAADLHLHAGEVRDHPGDQRDRVDADRVLARPERARLRARHPDAACGKRARPCARG